MNLYYKILLYVFTSYFCIIIWDFWDSKNLNNKLRSYCLSIERKIKVITTIVLATIVILNAIDGLSTWFAISTGLAEELNGMMGWIISQGWIVFFIFKIGIGTFAIFSLYITYIKEKRLISKKPMKVKRNPAVGLVFSMMFMSVYSFICYNNIEIILIRMQ
jgi:hypothetical protein